MRQIGVRKSGARSLGADYVAKSAPNGRTLLAVSSPHYANKSIYPKLPFDPVKDFRAVAGYGEACLGLVVPEDSPFKKIQDLVTFAQANPGKLTYSSSGNGAVTHLAAAEFLSRAHATAVHVPYKGGDGAVADVAANQISFTFAPLTAVVPLVEGRRMRLLAVSSARRVASVPHVPTVAESGFPGYEVVSFFGFLVPAATPDDRIAALSRAMVAIAKTNQFVDFATLRGFSVHVTDSVEFGKTRQAEMEHWAALVAKSGAKQE
ncbi:Bug family tripartite tricarboxylate transporter substrate binding protein [Xylophilus sp.]|uniref:Bug family tripartite tricarboxylate transporter substrate binding protein n=1 Tax=Xylophilus sp. TaxID=2653893 RepID=UPI0013B9577E|nr:tripartite tricarboxylate transporter substrate binding protein [Xylophilus sp.]KAF1047499.1 MAG: hypothetical protein GAK38_01850 [Xylophilus sp.]